MSPAEISVEVVAWMMAELKRRGYSNVRQESCEALLRRFPDRDEALVAWESIAAGRTYTRSEGGR